MKRANLFHPRIFSNQEWAEGYHKRNAKNIQRVGKRFVRLLNESGFEHGQVLDTGCGFGVVAIEIARNFPEVTITGLDLGRPLLRIGRGLAEKAGVADRIDLLEGDVEKLDYPDHSFDLVINTFMLHIVDNPITMLNEIERVVKPDGRIMITDLRRIWMGLFVKKLKTSFTMDEARDIFTKSAIRPGAFSTGPFWWDYMVNL